MRKVTIQFNDEDPIEIGKTNTSATWTVTDGNPTIQFVHKNTGEKFTIRLEEDTTKNTTNG